MQVIDDLIARAPTFAGMGPNHVRIIAGCAVNTHRAAGDYLFREGEAADRFYLIRTGTVALELLVPTIDRLVVETLHEGEVVGWSWLFEPYQWHFDARVTEPTRLVEFDGACMRGKCDADHELGYELMRRFATVMVTRLQATRLQMLDVYGHPARA